jgi:TetR/AcrR family transcriptional repressor of nem operon
MSAPRTIRGQETRARITAAASELVRERGVTRTSLDDVIERAGVSKSQLYLYFADRDALLRAVIAYNTELVLSAVGNDVARGSWRAIRTWFDSMTDFQRAGGGRRGCPVGTLVAQLAESDEAAQRALAESFDRWQAPLTTGLEAMKARGKLKRHADVGALTTATMASIQGGLLLTQARRDPSQLAIALDAAYAHLRQNATGSG